MVEDAAQALGAEYVKNGKARKAGSMGTLGAFSFFPSKNLGCMGDGGMVVTNNRQVYERVEMLRRHGGKVKYHHSEVGLNSRLDELQAAILRIKLKHLDCWNEARRRNACRYNRLLADQPPITRPSELGSNGPVVPTDPNSDEGPVRCVYHQYTLLADNRDEIVAALKQADIGCLVYYPIPLHLQEVHRGLGCPAGSFPVAEDIARRCFSIPMFPELTEHEQSEVAAVIKTAASTSTDRDRAA